MRRWPSPAPTVALSTTATSWWTTVPEEPTGRGGAVGAWRNAFIGVNAGLTVGLGLLADTFETAITWDRWPDFDAEVRERVGVALRGAMSGARLSCRFTTRRVPSPTTESA